MRDASVVKEMGQRQALLTPDVQTVTSGTSVSPTSWEEEPQAGGV